MTGPLSTLTVRARGDGATHGGIREVERDSIRAFVQSAADAGLLRGRVLDYGCGKQPYRGIVEAAGGEYLPYDRASFPANVSGDDVGEWPAPVDAILCNQVAQYWPDPGAELSRLHNALRNDGVLVITFPTSWDEVEPADLWRFTRSGMSYLLESRGFTIERWARRAEVELGGFRFPLGYGIVARV